jgi:hypothetical protein
MNIGPDEHKKTNDRMPSSVVSTNLLILYPLQLALDDPTNDFNNLFNSFGGGSIDDDHLHNFGGGGSTNSDPWYY